MVRPRGDARPSRIAWGGRKAVAASASRSIECRGIGSVRLVVSVATGSVTQRIDYDELASSGAIAVRRRAGPSREEWGGRGTPKGDILHPLCLAERGDPAGAAPARGVQGRRAVARNFNTQVDGSVATGGAGPQFHRHHRYPGPHPLTAARFFALPANFQFHGASKEAFFAGSWGHPICIIMGPPARGA